MRRRIVPAGTALALLIAPAAWAQQPAATSVVGSWRGNAAATDSETAPVILTILERDGGYGGFVTGFDQGREVPLSSVTVDGAQLIAEASADSDLGTVTVRYELTLEEDELKGSQRVAFGNQSAAFGIELKRRRRRDVPQPQVEQRVGYFVGNWEFEYTGGEYPPLSLGPRTGRVTFTQAGDAPFVTGQVSGDVYGEAYAESIVIGYDEKSNFLVFRETLSTGVELLSVADWQSPIAINFVTSPVEADGQIYQLRRVFSITSDTAFMVTEEFSIDGGPFRRLGNGRFSRVE